MSDRFPLPSAVSEAPVRGLLTYGLRLASLLGLLLFSVLFAATFAPVTMIERPAKAFIQARVEQNVRDKVEALQKIPLEGAADMLARRIGIDIDHLKQRLKAELPNVVESVILEMQDPNCTCRQYLARIVPAQYQVQLSSLAQVKDRLLDLARNQYAHLVQGLVMDLRIFTGANAALFLILFVASWAERRSLVSLLVPSALLMMSVLASVFFYLFAQNWFYSIVYNDYVGFGYLAYVSAIFLFLCDIILNQAQVTLAIVRTVGEALGATSDACSC